MLQSPSEFMTAVQALLATQEQALTNSAAAAGEHLCFIGSGREDEDQYVHMVVAHFLQRHSQYVGIVSGGYAGRLVRCIGLVCCVGAQLRVKILVLSPHIPEVQYSLQSLRIWRNN